MADWGAMGMVSVNRDDGIWIVKLTGEQDFTTVRELRITLDALFTPEMRPHTGPTLVVVDLTHCQFFDSSVAHVIVRAHEVAQRHPKAYMAVAVGGRSRESFATRTLRLMGVTQLLPTFTSRQAAATALAEISTAKAPEVQ